MTDSYAGKLLVATPELLDPNFHRTVVLICLHDEEGAFGLVLNRPLEERVVDHLPAWGEWATQPPVIFHGGPVDASAVVGLARARAIDALSIPVSRGIGLLHLEREPGEWLESLDAMRVFVGYAGWGGGQLEAEVAQNAWFVVDALPGDPFTEEPEVLYRNVLRRQPGELAMFAFLPADPSVN
jgi:putative transcriptional regulator